MCGHATEQEAATTWLIRHPPDQAQASNAPVMIDSGVAPIHNAEPAIDLREPCFRLLACIPASGVVCPTLRGYRTWATRGACGRPASDLPKAAALVNPTWLLQPRSPRRDAGADGPVLDFRFDSPELRERQRRSGGRSGDKGAVRSRPRETSAARSKQRSRCPVLTPLKLPGVRESGSLSGLYLDAVLFWFGTRVSLSVGWSPGVSSVARFCPRPLGVRSHRLHAEPWARRTCPGAVSSPTGTRFRRLRIPLGCSRIIVEAAPSFGAEPSPIDLVP